MVEIVHIVLFTVLAACGSNCKKFKPLISKECEEQGYCESVSNYPTDQVEKVIAELGDKITFQNDSIDPKDLNTRRADTTKQVDFCSIAEKQIIHPQALQDKNNDWHFVLNKKNEQFQGFYVEVCTSSSCNSLVTIQEGYKGACIQKYTYRLIATLDRKGFHEMKSLKLPSCCSCVASTSPF